MAKSTKPASALTTSSTFSVTGSFAPSIFRFFQGEASEVAALIARNEGVAPLRKLPSVLLHTKQGYIGTNSVYLNEKDAADPAKVNQRLAPNPGAKDSASLSADKDTLVVVGTLKFIKDYYTKPCNCDNPAYAEYMQGFVQSYIADGNMTELMRRYLSNIVTGRILWRNRYGFDLTCVISLRLPGQAKEHFTMQAAAGDDFERLVARVSDAAAKAKHFQLEVALAIELGFDAEVYPSQPFVQPDDKNAMRGVKKDASYGRLLAAKPDVNGEDQVFLSADKIGNALRTVDFGYAPDAQEPIAVELYGAVMSQRTAHRLSGNSYFDLVSKKAYADMTAEERHYVMAVFIKGGLLGFGGKGE